MQQIDWVTVSTWIVSGLIGTTFGIVSTWATYRFERKRDLIAWEKERKQQLEKFEHEQKMLELQFQQRLVELDLNFKQERLQQLRIDLLRGIDNPHQAIENLYQSIATFNNEQPKRFSTNMASETELLSRLEKELLSFLSNNSYPKGSA